MEELIDHVKEAYNELPLPVCIKVWTTAQMVMNEIIIHNGHNTYKLPHAAKDKLICAASTALPLCLPCQALINGGALTMEMIMDVMKSQAAGK